MYHGIMDDRREQREQEILAALRERKAAADSASAALADAILDAIRDGIRQTDIARATSYSRERLRQLARSAGIGPEPRPGRKRAARH